MQTHYNKLQNLQRQHIEVGQGLLNMQFQNYYLEIKMVDSFLLENWHKIPPNLQELGTILGYNKKREIKKQVIQSGTEPKGEEVRNSCAYS